MPHRLYLAGVALALLCSGCASTTWVKASVTDAQTRKDLDQCEEEVHESVEFRSDPAQRAEMRRLVERCMLARGVCEASSVKQLAVGLSLHPSLLVVRRRP